MLSKQSSGSSDKKCRVGVGSGIGAGVGVEVDVGVCAGVV